MLHFLFQCAFLAFCIGLGFILLQFGLMILMMLVAAIVTAFDALKRWLNKL